MYAGKLAVGTLEQRRVLIGRWHRENGFEYNPNDSDSVRKIMRGIRKKYNRKQKQAKPTAIQSLEKMIVQLDGHISQLNVAEPGTPANEKRLKGTLLQCIRDKAMILTAFWFGQRSDELIHIRLCDLEFFWDSEPPYFELYLPKSKTDREAGGNTKKLEALPSLCAMSAMRDWIEASTGGVDSKRIRNSELAVFVKVTAWGTIYDKSIHPNSINKMLKRRFEEAGLDPEEYSSHSMRRGVANWLTDSGTSMKELMDWIGWRDERTAMRYQDGKESLPSQIIAKNLREQRILSVEQILLDQLE